MSDELITSVIGQLRGVLRKEEAAAVEALVKERNAAEAKLAKAVETLREFAKQKPTTEMDVDEYDQADIEGAYCQFIFKAHAVLAELEGK